MKTIPWVKGNTMPVAVPLQTKTAVDGKWVIEDYTPPAGSEINVNIVAGQRRYKYDFTLDGNVVRFTDDGHLPVGEYGVEITVKEPDDFNRRTFKCAQIRVYECTNQVGMLPDGEMLLDAALFIQGQQGIQGIEGKQGPPGSDATVTTENINRALGYTPTSPDDVEQAVTPKLDAPTDEQFNLIFN